MKLKNILLVLAATTIGLASCSSENDMLEEINTPAISLDEIASVSFNLTDGLQTKATEEASADETNINTYMIAIFDHATGTLLAKREDNYTASGITGIQTKAIESDILVIANCPVGTFAGVTTKEGFKNKVVGGDDNLKANNLIKYAELTCTIDANKEYATDPIKIEVHQLSACVDLQLNLKSEAYPNAILKIKNVRMDKANRSASLNAGETTNFVTVETNPAEAANSIIRVKAGQAAQSVGRLYTYEYKTDNQTKQAVLTITATIQDDETGEEETIELRTIVIDGNSDHSISRGNLYQIIGTVQYEGSIEVSVSCTVKGWKGNVSVSGDMIEQ